MSKLKKSATSLTRNQLIVLYFHKVLSGKTVGVTGAVSGLRLVHQSHSRPDDTMPAAGKV